MEARGQEWLVRLGWWVIGRMEADGRAWPVAAYFGQQYWVWQQLATRMMAEVEKLGEGEAREVLRAVSELIVL